MPEGFMHNGNSLREIQEHNAARQLAKSKGLRFSEALRRVRQRNNR